MHYNLKKDFQHSHMVSALCAFAGLNDEAIYWLENATHRGFWNYPFLAEHETAFKELRNDPPLFEFSHPLWKILIFMTRSAQP